MKSVSSERELLIRRVHDHISGVLHDRDALLSDVWAYQTQNCSPLHIHAQSYGLEPGVAIEPAKIEPVHTSAFRWGDLVSCAKDSTQCVAEFHSSGTTKAGQKSRHRLFTLELYEAAICHSFREALPEVEKQSFQFVSLLPTNKSWPNSSLVHMFDTLIQRFDAEHGVHACQDDGTPDPNILKVAIQHARARKVPVLLFGAAFSHVSLLDSNPQEDLRLPEGSVVLETGGTKGKTRSVERHDLLEMIEQRYGVPTNRILGEYGMAELGSQAYGWAHEDTLKFPPWVRIEVRDPDSNLPMASNQPGILRIYDPVNVDSCSFIETSDLAIQLSDTEFKLLGRALQSDPKGCSLLVPGELPQSEASISKNSRLRRTHRPHGSELPMEVRGQNLAEAWALLGRSSEVRGRGLAQMIGDSMGLSQPSVAEALMRESKRWTNRRISELVSREVSPFQTGRVRAESIGQVLVIPASTVPFAGLETVTVALLAGASVDVRPSRRNPAEISYFVRALEKVAPKLRERVRIISSNDDNGLYDAIDRAQCIVVHGSDDTIDYFQKRAAPSTRLIAYGPRWSLLVVQGEDSKNQEAMDSIAEDIILHDSLGCLSPRLILVWGNQADTLKINGALGESLKTVSKRFPTHPDVARRSIGAGQIKAVTALLARRERGIHSVHRHGLSNLVVLAEAHKKNYNIETPIPVIRRGSVLANIPTQSSPDRWFNEINEALSTVAISPTLRGTSEGDSIEEWAMSVGASRITNAGRMQRPPSAWPHDGRPLLLPYIQLVTPG